MKLDKLLNQIPACLQHPSPAEQLASLQQLLRNPIEIDALGQFPESRTNTAYPRVLLSHPQENFQAIAAFWQAGQSSSIHDHRGIVGAVKCLKGEILEKRYSIAADNGQESRLELGQQNVLNPQQEAVTLTPENGQQIHSMHNLGSETAVSLHIYLQPLTQFRKFKHIEANQYQYHWENLWFEAQYSQCQSDYNAP